VLWTIFSLFYSCFLSQNLIVLLQFTNHWTIATIFEEVQFQILKYLSTWVIHL
jgi:hypothetical protein